MARVITGAHSRSRGSRYSSSPVLLARSQSALAAARAIVFREMAARDTSAKAAAIQERLHDALGPEGRFELAMKMSELAREFAKAGVRDRHPHLSDREVLQELARIFYGKRDGP